VYLQCIRLGMKVTLITIILILYIVWWNFHLPLKCVSWNIYDIKMLKKTVWFTDLSVFPNIILKIWLILRILKISSCTSLLTSNIEYGDIMIGFFSIHFDHVIWHHNAFCNIFVWKMSLWVCCDMLRLIWTW
jgi:hypothetical protein